MGQGAKPPQVNAFLHLYNPRSWPTSPKICFGRKKIRRTFGAHGPPLAPGPASDYIIRYVADSE